MVLPHRYGIAPLFIFLITLLACSNATTVEAITGLSRQIDADWERGFCRAQIGSLLNTPDLGGSPAFEHNRIEILGRARGEPLVLIQEPKEASDILLPSALLASKRAFVAGRPGSRVFQLLKRHRGGKQDLRMLLLREGYVFSTDPLDALALVTSLELTDLFDDPEIWLMRGKERFRLERKTARREPLYVHTTGLLAGRRADLLLGDRVAVTEAELTEPLHRDLRALANDLGFDRARILHRTRAALLVELRFGNLWVKAVLQADDATLSLACLDADKSTRTEIQAFEERDHVRRRAIGRMHRAITEQVGEALRFDRPQGETTADRDGQLRPLWASAYRNGWSQFDFEDTRYAVFNAEGNPWPPQVCVDFVLDTFERASGTWYAPRGSSPKRVVGNLNFDDIDIPNRRGVIAFSKFAETYPDLFEVRRFQGKERIPFGQRSQFFEFLLKEADSFRSGDVVAIHGLKRDGRIHQHALLVEWTDPITGFPHGLADQMKRPRRRTWEGIMAEAPKRSLLYRARPSLSLIAKLDHYD